LIRGRDRSLQRFAEFLQVRPHLALKFLPVYLEAGLAPNVGMLGDDASVPVYMPFQGIDLSSHADDAWRQRLIRDGIWLRTFVEKRRGAGSHQQCRDHE
jgi:hypothetical protein